MRVCCPLGLRIQKVLMPFSARIASSAMISALLVCQAAFAFDTPLSDQAVREAYFLGQRHDETMSTLSSTSTQNSFRPRRLARTSPPSLSSLPSPFSSSNPASTLPVTVLSKRRSIIATRANS